MEQGQAMVYRRTMGMCHKQTRQLHYWHKADGGYIVWRKRKLKDQRARILQQLAELS
jgi:hypothetical protein